MNRNACLLLLCLSVLLAPPAMGAAAPLQEHIVLQGDTTGMDWSRVPEYRIVPGDVLVIDFGRQEAVPGETPRRHTVRPDGRISLFPVGDVVAAGRTPAELERMLTDLLAAEFRNPRLVVEVAELAGNRVHVIGRVRTPGSYPAAPFMTVIQAITAAGGFEDDAARNSVLVFHRDGARTVRVSRLRVHEGLKSGRLDTDLPLSRFDIVYVPRSAIGNLNVFTRQFFAEQIAVLNFALVGWELFNLDRVFVIPNTGQ